MLNRLQQRGNHQTVGQCDPEGDALQLHNVDQKTANAFC